MGIAIQLRKEHTIKLKKETNKIELESEITDPEWTTILVDDKWLPQNDYKIQGKFITLTKSYPKSTIIMVRDFFQVRKGKKK